MKIKTILAICKANHSIQIINDSDGNSHAQWLGDGTAFYPLFDMPVFDERTFKTTFELNDKQCDYTKFDNTQIKRILNSLVEMKLDTPSEALNLDIIYLGHVLTPIITSDGIKFIDRRYLAPFRNTSNIYLYEERHPVTNKIFFVVKAGFLTCGIIFPYEINDSGFKENLFKLYTNMKSDEADKSK